GHHRQRGADVVIGHEQRGVPEGLDAPRLLAPFRRRFRARGLHREPERATPAHRPVDPKPYVSRTVASSSSTATHSTISTRWTTSCAMRSPRDTVYGSVGSVFTSSTFSSPRYSGSMSPGV